MYIAATLPFLAASARDETRIPLRRASPFAKASSFAKATEDKTEDKADVYKDGKVSYNKIELGRRMGNRYEVISGVQDGDLVVTAGYTKLSDGMEVEVIK